MVIGNVPSFRVGDMPYGTGQQRWKGENRHAPQASASTISTRQPPTVELRACVLPRAARW